MFPPVEVEAVEADIPFLCVGIHKQQEVVSAHSVTYPDENNIRIEG